METIKKWMSELVVLSVASAFFCFRLLESSSFNPDLGRDLMWIWDIIHGNQTLLGPKLSFGGYYLAPYYYYLFAPFVALSHGFPAGLVVANAVFAAVCTGGIFYLLRKNNGILFAALGTIWLAITSYFLFSARNPGNAYSYVPALALQLLIFLYAKKTRHFYFVMGLVSGCILNFHPAAVFAMVPFYLGTLPRTTVREFFLRSMIFSAGVGILYTPIILFEVRHNFVMFTNTFITKSYQAFIGGQSAATMMRASINPLRNIGIVDHFLSPWMSPSIIWLVSIVVATYVAKKTDRTRRGLAITFGLLTIFHFALQFQVAFHYAFPLLIGLQIIVLYGLASTKRALGVFLLVVCVIFAVISFPQQFFMRPYREFRLLYPVAQAAMSKLPIGTDAINIAFFGGNPLATLGYEYRYIAKVLGYTVLGEQEYANSDYLLVVSEQGPLNFSLLHTWELDQFGKKMLVKKVSVGSTIFYLFRKS